MKRKILNSLVGVAMLGAAASANAFFFASTSDLNGTTLVAGGRNALGSGASAGAFSFDMVLKPGDRIDADIFSSAHTLLADGQFGLDYRSAASASPDGVLDFFRDYNNRTVFNGSMQTTTTGDVPDIIDFASTASNLAGLISIAYNGTFTDFPLLGISGTGAGVLNIGWGYTAASKTLAMNITENSLAGWTGFEGALLELSKSLTGSPVGLPVFSSQAYLGQTVVNGPDLASSDGNFRVTAVPEPASLALLGLGLAGLGMMRRRKA